MNIVHKLSVDLIRKNTVIPVNAMQGDSNTRVLEISLLANSEEWQIPKGTTAAFAFSKPDGSKGMYNKLPDNTDAISINNNVVRVVLAPQVLTVAGSVTAVVVLSDPDLDQLATFPINIVVERNPSGGDESNDYYEYTLSPEFAESESWLEANGNIRKLYVLPDGYIWAYRAYEEYPYTNQIPLSVDTDKSVYNGIGYKTGYRINRSGEEVEAVGNAVTGFIPIKVGDVLHFKNIDYRPGVSASGGYLCFYNGNFEYIQAAKAVDGLDSITFVVGEYTTDETTGQLTTLTVGDKYDNGVSYFRISSNVFDNSTIITVNEEITDEPVVSYRWTNTGLAFVPADYEDRIIKAENDIAALKRVVSGDIAVYGIVDNENNIIMTGSLTVGKYKLMYMDEDGTTREIGEFNMW